MKTKWYLKVTTENLGSPYAAWNGRYKIGKWLPNRKPDMCASGWHATSLKRLKHYLSWYHRVFVCVVDGEVIEDEYKIAAERMMLVFELGINNPAFARFLGQRVRAKRRKLIDKILKDGYFTRKAINSRRSDIVSAISEHYGEVDIDWCKYLVGACSDKVERELLTKWIESQLRKLGYK